MQNYIDALIAHADKAEKLAAQDCAKARKVLKDTIAKRPAVVAKIIGVPASEVSEADRYGSGSFVKRWPGVTVRVSGHESWQAQKEAESAAQTRIGECCANERAAKDLKSTAVANKLRAFVRARYGSKPKAAPSAVIAAFIDATQPVVCKV